jgi:AcrR family transcriptional regulator
MPRPRSDICPRIVQAARARFLKDGVDGASLRDIARDAKTSIGMVYYYFATKDDLFFAVVEEVYARLLEDLSAALAPDASVELRIERLFVRISQANHEEADVLRLVVREALVSSERLDGIIARFRTGHVPLVLRTIVDGMRDGTLDATRHPALLFATIAAVGGAAQMVLRTAGERLPFIGVPSGEQLCKQLLDIVLHGIGGKPQPATKE